MLRYPGSLTGRILNPTPNSIFQGPRFGLQMLWHGGGLSATTIKNSNNPLAGLQHDGTLGAGMTIGDGKFGRALKFGGGTTSYVDVGTAIAQSVSSEWSIAGWCCPLAVSGAVWGESNTSNLVTMGIFINGSGFLEWDHNHGAWTVITGANTVTLGQWHHFCATFHATNGMALYLNGVLQGTDANTVQTANGNHADIGAWFNSAARAQNFNGMIDMVGFWVRALPAGDVRRLFYEPMLPFGYYQRRVVSDIAANATSRSYGIIL